MIGTAWAYGGNANWVRDVAAAWGSLGVVITFMAVRASKRRHQRWPKPLLWLWPLALFNLVVLASLFNPSFTELTDGVRDFYVPGESRPHWPSTARPDLSLRALWFFDATYLSCFNLVLTLRQRRAIRYLLLAVLANAVLLAIYGTIQKLVGAESIYFAGPKAVQPYFFASFIYHNHWGAFTLLMMALALGLVFQSVRQSATRDFWHSPGPVAFVAVLLLAASIPLSGSRSCTVLAGVFLLGALLHWLVVFMRRAHQRPVSKLLLAAAALVGLTTTGFFAYDLARPMIDKRLDDTYEQIEKVRANPGASTRFRLYRDTWLLAQDKPWFGWGMASFPTAFYLRNSQRFPVPGLSNEIHFHDAHNDWLQSLAEVGFVGTALLGLCALVPAISRRRILFDSPLTTYLCVGLALLLLYAWAEFPFGNRAVVVTFWVFFFAAVHYGRCDASRRS